MFLQMKVEMGYQRLGNQSAIVFCQCCNRFCQCGVGNKKRRKREGSQLSILAREPLELRASDLGTLRYSLVQWARFYQEPSERDSWKNISESAKKDGPQISGMPGSCRP